MRFLLVGFALLELISCTHIERKRAGENKGYTFFKEYLKGNIRYRSLINDPEDSLVFGLCKSSVDNDTSWILLIKKTGDDMHAHYNQLLPFYISGFDEYLTDSTKLTYSESFDFIIKKKKWDSLINQSGLDRYVAKDTIRYTGCPHCPDYTVYYDSKLILNNKSDNTFLIQLDILLHQYFISWILEKKSNPPIKLDK